MKTILQHFNELPEGEFKTWVLSNLDTRYTEHGCYSVNYALTLGVKCAEGDFRKINQYIQDNPPKRK